MIQHRTRRAVEELVQKVEKCFDWHGFRQRCRIPQVAKPDDRINLFAVSPLHRTGQNALTGAPAEIGVEHFPGGRMRHFCLAFAVDIPLIENLPDPCMQKIVAPRIPAKMMQVIK
jgi:hypothetical protein